MTDCAARSLVEAFRSANRHGERLIDELESDSGLNLHGVGTTETGRVDTDRDDAVRALVLGTRSGRVRMQRWGSAEPLREAAFEWIVFYRTSRISLSANRLERIVQKQSPARLVFTRLDKSLGPEHSLDMIAESRPEAGFSCHQQFYPSETHATTRECITVGSVLARPRPSSDGIDRPEVGRRPTVPPPPDAAVDHCGRCRSD